MKQKEIGTQRWWEWNGGSSTFLWHWPDEYQRDLWEGSPPWFVGEPPTGKEKQRPYKSKEAKGKVKHKMDTVVRRGYMVLVMANMLLSLMDMFDVPKGENDI
jgi:hypothetical protein